MRRILPFRRRLILLLPLLALLAACGFPGIASTTAQLPIVSTTPQATPLPPVRLPQDEAPHKNLTEWWYYTGHFSATTPDGQTHAYGFEYVIFQALRSDIPPVYAAHFAITDLARGTFHYDQRRQTEPTAQLPNGSSTKGFDLRVADWSMQGLNGEDHLQATMPDYTLQANLQARKAPVLHNGNGLIKYGLVGFSYYYSRTQMALLGTLEDHGQALKISGQAWMDHQWGNFLTLGGTGWDWYSVQLENQTEMMLYVIRDASGRPVSTYVGLIGPNGEDRVIPGSDLRIKALASWTSPVTGAHYPSGWSVEVNAPGQQLSLTLTPQLKDQELVVYRSTGNVYWEGAVSIQGQTNGRAVQGKGYVELTGYGK